MLVERGVYCTTAINAIGPVIFMDSVLKHAYINNIS